MSGMGKTFRQWSPEQGMMFPPTPMDLVEKDGLVRFILNLVREELDLSGILNQYQEERGYPPFHPEMMTGLLLYSYCQGNYSSRRIARGRLSIKLCLTEPSTILLKAGLEHGIELRKRSGNGACDGSPSAIL